LRDERRKDLEKVDLRGLALAVTKNRLSSTQVLIKRVVACEQAQNRQKNGRYKRLCHNLHPVINQIFGSGKL
jgi:hypothetical protein